MPYIKIISVRNSVAGCLKYIANPDKTNEQLFLTGLNCSEDISIAEKEFCLTYQHYSHKNFYDKPQENGKSPVKAFHIIQSFKSGECDPDLAHKIGVEWIQRYFGRNFQAVVTTHTDHEHIHNHVCLCHYDLDGVKFNGNKRMLEHIRNGSDVICMEHGIGEMEKLMNEKKYSHVGVSYGEWKHRKRGTSWKEIIRNKIDILIPKVKSFDEMLEELEQQGYSIKRGKYISVKAPEQQRFIRLKTLGDEYSEESISRRIQEYLDSFPKVKTLSEIISEVMEEFKYQTKKFSFAQGVRDSTTVIANQLKMINEEGLSSISQVKDKLSEVEKIISDTQSQLDDLEAKKKAAEDIISAAERYFKKYKLLGKNKEYPKSDRQADKALLSEYGIKSLDDIEDFRNNVQEYSDSIAELQKSLNEIKMKEDDYKSLIETCSGDDYITRLIKAVREKMNEQEKAKLKSLQEETYTIYHRNDNIILPYKELTNEPNIDDYIKANTGSWFDIEGETNEDRLEKVYETNNLRVGDIIIVKTSNGETASYVNDYGFMDVKDFTKSHSEQLRQKQLQEEKQKQTAVKKKKSRGR